MNEYDIVVQLYLKRSESDSAQGPEQKFTENSRLPA